MTTSQNHPIRPLDTTGQVAPPGMEPRVTATLWEDECTLCFHVQARGVQVSRREGKYSRQTRVLSQCFWLTVI